MTDSSKKRDTQCDERIASDLRPLTPEERDALAEATMACTHRFKWVHRPGKYASLADIPDPITSLRRKPRSYMDLDGARNSKGDHLVLRTNPQTGAGPGEQAPEGKIWMPGEGGVQRIVKRRK